MAKMRTPVAHADATHAQDIKPKRLADARQAFSGRPTTVRFPTDIQKRLAVAAEITGKSVSELMREGAECVIEMYVGADAEAAAARIRAATEANAARMRKLYGLSDEP